MALAFAMPSDARIKRSQSAKVEFKQQQPCPASGAIKGPCKGYVIDHIQALACGGPDHTSNMQWQTIAEGKAKDKWERCRLKSKVAKLNAAARCPCASAKSKTSMPISFGPL